MIEIGKLARGLLLTAMVAPVLTGCLIYDGTSGKNVVVQVGSKTGADAPALETLSAARFENGSLVVRVGSNGCTSVSDFAVSVTGGDPTEISIKREKPDLCRAIVPEGVELRWTYAELGLTAGVAARIMNPVVL